MDSPISAVLVSWGNAWLGGHVGLDEAVDHVERAGGPQVVADGPRESTLRAFLAGLRADGLGSFRLALPIPGDPLGLAGPPTFNISAIEAGQAAIAVLRGRRLGLVPEADRRGSSYSGVRWTVVESADSEPYVPSLAEAEQALTAAMRAATNALVGVAGPGPGTPALKDGGETLAPGYSGRAHRVGALAARLAMALDLAGERGLTSGQLAARSEALRELDRAVRRARVAAHHAIVEGQRQG
ncbi:hypothetical protein [Microtetraspora sp. NBRC 16547]|uniref:hypothetical protein n=1 Tax=Microtetraspora sp. NBRC 16547 TaxID=3030993 RepID=UPI0025566E04|nr:hypothetical protein [Microtetraspora sp. NBRC 16547]